MSVANLGYVLLSSVDLPGWRRFGVATIGAMDTAACDDAVALKIDEHPFRMKIIAGNEDRLTAIGWEMSSVQSLDAMQERLVAAGLSVRNGSSEDAELRCVSAFIAATDPAGNPMEFYYGRTGTSEPFTSPAGFKGFVTGDMGLGHIVIPAPANLENTRDFYRDVLGFGQSDDLTITLPNPQMPKIRVLFLHGDNPRHHSLALGSLPSPTGITHLMFELEDLDDVGRSLDRALSGGWKLMASLGRHCNDNMLSFYVVGPGGVVVEIGCDGLQVDWNDFEPTVSTVPDHWGHAYELTP
jgi:3,4-dihydroxy-9,10-secoandrosta-1,3,5(10)-triene-9,17-dione 4,5-dioxygenase